MSGSSSVSTQIENSENRIIRISYKEHEKIIDYSEWWDGFRYPTL